MFPFDRVRAEQILSDAGWVPGPDWVRVRDGARAEFTVMYFPQDTLRRDLSQAFASDASKIGVRVNVEAVDRSVFPTSSPPRPGCSAGATFRTTRHPAVLDAALVVRAARCRQRLRQRLELREFADRPCPRRRPPQRRRGRARRRLPRGADRVRRRPRLRDAGVPRSHLRGARQRLDRIGADPRAAQPRRRLGPWWNLREWTRP